MDTVIPFISCLVTPEELPEVLDSVYYQEIYVESKENPGVFTKYIKLSNNRRLKVHLRYGELPSEVIKVLNAREIDMLPEINFLTNGKVPKYLFDRIVAFFRKVMEVKKSEVEAHAWIVWNQEQGYHIVVPKQNISKAAVSFEYDEVNKPGNIIVVDIHSHNTMSAFYSGTDNASDEKSINYSMVIGNLKPDSYSYVIRFNIFKHKVAAKFDDVFDESGEASFEVPQEWLDKIVTPPIRTYPTGNKITTFGKGNSTPRTFHSPGKRKDRSYFRGLADDDFWGRWAMGLDETIDLETGEIVKRSSSSVEEPEESDILQAMYGEECGEAVEQISAYLEDLTENSEALLDVIRQAYAMLDDKGRYELATNGF